MAAFKPGQPSAGRIRNAAQGAGHELRPWHLQMTACGKEDTALIRAELVGIREHDMLRLQNTPPASD